MQAHKMLGIHSFTHERGVIGALIIENGFFSILPSRGWLSNGVNRRLCDLSLLEDFFFIVFFNVYAVRSQ